ncbi:hypothetical protein HYH02_006223 [Chlamydomonas schloesseri]|uniref:Uncharacterized protein n=1 Tax=Chlamydomonas schloesseri TaxID=2026947 RepID=A0A835WJK3_9CHLO|nr:hypothetical protein HYH02_006223 [Chlamydomonas schloesseri]|eukprot:KAG2448874.1 hypothetical protein HYH02_006223 [Chlamydomonas schloesseri]
MAAQGASPAGELVVATDIRGTLFRRALTLLDDVHTGLEDFGALAAGTSELPDAPGDQQLALIPGASGLAGGGAADALVPHSGADVLERLLTSVVQGRTNTARRAVDAVAQIHSEIDSILASFEREFPATAEGDNGGRGWGGYGWDEPSPGQPSEEVLQMAAATTAAAARFRVRAAEAAQKALQLYDAAAKQAAVAAQATTRALELQASAEQHSAEGNLPQALEDIREANRLREESVEAARKSQQLQQEYLRQRKEAQEAHAQADAAMRHAYGLEHEALAVGLAAATRDRDQLHERFDGLLRQVEGLQGQAAQWDTEADAAISRAEQAQQEADAQIAAGNYELGNARMQEAVRAQEHAGYARQQAAGARDAAQRLETDMRTARERLDSAEQVLADLNQRQSQLQEASTKQRQERMQEEAAGLAALCQSAEGATALHEQLVTVYDERLAQDQQQYDLLLSQGKTAEAEGLAVHINTWRELLEVARQNRDTSRVEAASMRTRLQELSTQALMGENPAALAIEGSVQGFEELRGAPDRTARARQAVRVLARDLASSSSPGLSVEEADGGADALTLQTDLHRHRSAMLAKQLQDERRKLPGSDASSESQQQAEALLDSMAVSHLVGALEASRLLQLWKQRSEQANAGAEEVRRVWQDIEQAASAQEDEAVRLEEQALRLHDAGQHEEAAATMAQAEELHRTAERLRVDADRARGALHAREKAANDALEQQRALVQGLHTVERAAERLQAELQQRGFDIGTVVAQDTVVPERQLATQEETATVMMASPSMLSRNSSTATLGAGYGLGVATGSPGPWSTGAGGQSGGGSDQPAQGDAPSDTARPLLPLGRTSIAPGRSGGSGGDSRELQLLQELEAHAAVVMPEFPASRWDGYSALVGALEASAIDADVLVAVATSTSNLQLDAQGCGGLAEQEQHRDSQRLERWKSVAAALPSDALSPAIDGIVERTSARCSHVLAAANLLVEALKLQGECHGTLSGTLNAYRRALAGLHSAQEESQAARAEAMAVHAQAQDSLGMDAALLAQVQQLEAELSTFEAAGAAAQALTTRFDLQRLQNKHMEAASQAGQLHAAYETARQRAEQARKKEAEASTVGQTLNSVAMLHAKAATEADEGVRYALDAYSNALAALVMGARDSIAQLTSDAPLEEVEVQLRLERLTGSTSNSRRCMAAARQLHEAAGAESAAGAGRITAAVKQAMIDLGELTRQTSAPASESRMREAFESNLPVGMSGGSFTRRSQLADSSSARSLSPSRFDAAAGEMSATTIGAAHRVGSSQAASTDPVIQALQAIELELDILHRRHQQELDGLSPDADPDGSAAAEEAERQAVRQELQGQLREAERQLESVRRQHESMRDPTPAEMQASYDLLQSHEQHVAMLQHALTACDELSRGNLRRARAAARGAELQVRYCEDAAELLKRAADTSRSTIAELESALRSTQNEAEAESLRQRLQDMHGMAEDISRRQGDVAAELKAAQTRRSKAAEQLAFEELAARLRDEWLQQTRKAAAAVVTATAWEKRLAAARLEMEQLSAPVGDHQDKIKATGSLVQTIKAAAAQHRKQAADIARQAAEQREAARRLASSGQALEAESAKSMADSLQQQADGLIAQAAEMEEDARKQRVEVEDLERASGRAHILAAAKSDVLQHVAAAHQLAVTALQLRRAAAGKLNDAAVKHTQAAHEQAQLAGVDDELSAQEAQMSGGGLRPSELATHMINVARTKQQASTLRSALRATQQQVNQDREVALATARDAAKVEEQLAQIEPKITILEQQAAAAVERQDSFVETSSLNGSLGGARGAEGSLQRIPTFGSHDPAPHVSLTHASAALAGKAGDGDSRATPHQPLAGRPLLTSPLASQRESGSLQLRSSPAVGSEDSTAVRLGIGTAGSSMDEDPAPFGGQSGTVFGLAGAGGSQRVHLQHSPIDKQQREGGSGQHDSGQQPRFSVNIGLPGTQSQPTPHAGAGALNVPLARLKRGGAQQRQTSNLGQTAAGGASGVQLTPQGSPSPLSRSNSRTALSREDLFESMEDPRSLPSNASMVLSSRGLMRLPEVPSVQRQPPHLGGAPSTNIMSPMGSPRGRDRGDGDEDGSAGALLDKVARKALRPLSNVKVSVPPGAAGSGAKPGSRMLSSGGHRATNATGGGDYSSSDESEDSDLGPGAGSGGAGGGGDVQKRLSRASLGADLAELQEEQAEDEDEDVEPDTKMYRTAKQRLDDVEARILALRRQGDTANTAAEILGRKQDQLRMDMEEARDGDSAQRAALLSHGDAMIRLKESEGSLCHKQADMLEDETAACHDALHYATVDWRIRRELHRREERCEALTSQAQALAMEAQGYEADVADTTECVSLATAQLSKLQTDGIRHNNTIEQQRLSVFIEDQQRRLQTAKRRAADGRAGAARLATIARDAVARRQLCEKKSLCNKALYQSALELADACEQKAKVAAQAQHYRLVGLKAAADAIGARVQQLDSTRDSGSNLSMSSRGRGAMKVANRPTLHVSPEVMDQVARLADAAADCIQGYLEEMSNITPEAISVLRRRTDAIAGLMQLHQDAFDGQDHLALSVTAADAAMAKPAAYVGGASSASDSVDGGAEGRQQPAAPPTEAQRRVARIAAAEAAVHGLDRACAIAADLRAMCVEAAAAHGVLCDARSEPAAVQAQLLGHKDSSLVVDMEEVAKQQQRLTVLEVQLPLARDQLGAALQAVEYDQAAAKLAEARHDLGSAAAAALEAAAELSGSIDVRREALEMLRRHMTATTGEARIFRAGGNLLQATAADEAVKRLAADALAAEGSLAALVHESELRHEEAAMAKAAAEELRQVAEGSSELAALLLRTVDEQQEARAASGQVEELSAAFQRLEADTKAQQKMADACTKQADTLQHQSLQLRTDLKFSAADAHMAEARQCRAAAQEHLAAAAAAKQAAAGLSTHLKSTVQCRDQLLREVRLLHSAAGHLQEALTCMRDKHHLVRKLRDVEHQLVHRDKHSQAPEVEVAAGNGVPAKGKVAEADVLRTQLAASNSTIQHHLASKTSYLQAASNLRVSMTSIRRSAECAAQADAAMQEVLKARLAAATTGTDSPEGTSPKAKDASAATEASPNPDLDSPEWQLQRAELRFRCLQGSINALAVVAAAAERACDARRRQVHLSDQAAGLVSDLAAKILEAEANADEAAGLEASVPSAGGDEEDEEVLKTKLMINALLQKAETYRGEAAALQGRIVQLQQEERAADKAAAELESVLEALQADHRHTLEALDLTARIGVCREQESVQRAAARAQALEVEQLDREATGLESKAVQLRQQLTNASHSASAEDVANLMLVSKTMGAKAVAHRALQQQRKRELEAQEAECGRMAADIALMAQRAEHVLRASETQSQVREMTSRIDQLRADLVAAHCASANCRKMLEELREQFATLQAGVEDASGQPVTAAQTSASGQAATTQAAVMLTEQMLHTHQQRVDVLQAALTAWESARHRQEAVLRQQEQLVNQAEWRVRVERLEADLKAAAVAHTEKAKQLRENAGKGPRVSSASGEELAGTPDRADAGGNPAAVDPLKQLRAQAAAMRTAADATHQHVLAEAEEGLAARAAALAEVVSQQADRIHAAMALAAPMSERLGQAASTATSTARLQLACVGTCSDQGIELTAMHAAMDAVRATAGRIQERMEAAERQARAGQALEAAESRGQAAALQATLQAALQAVQASRKKLAELEARMRASQQELHLAERQLSLAQRPAGVAQTVAEYVHQACVLFFTCAERQPEVLRLVRMAAEAQERAEVARHETHASKAAVQQLIQAGKGDAARVVERAAMALEQSLDDAKSESRRLTAQADQESDACAADTAAAELYGDLALLSVRLLQALDLQAERQVEHDQLVGGLEALQRTLHSSQAALEQRRAEMQTLGSQIEAHRVEALMQRKRGNDAQACVRIDAAEELTSQLADVADVVMQLERRCEALGKKQVVMSSLCAKAEALVGMLAQLAQLCSAGVGHLMEARDAHDNHAGCLKDAARVAVSLSRQEEALASADGRVQQLHDSAAALQQQYQEALVTAVRASGHEDADEEDRQDPEQLLHAARTARAELLIARRRRAALQRDVLAIRNRLAAAETAVEISQLRISKARQRGEDAQRLVSSVLTLLDGSGAFSVDSAEVIASTSKVSHDIGTGGSGDASIRDATTAPSPRGDTEAVSDQTAKHRHAVLATAQLHSVTLQAVAEAISKHIEALQAAAAAEQARGNALAAAKAAAAAHQASDRQGTVIADLKRTATGASLAQDLQRLQLTGHARGTLALALPDAAAATAQESQSDAAEETSQLAVGAAEIELERLQHEAAYLEATAAQEQKLVSCLEQQHALLRRASDSLLDMARFGIAAELSASPHMTAYEAASLLASCKQLSQQHAVALTLSPPLEGCRHAEACLRGALECIQDARQARDSALGRRAAALKASVPVEQPSDQGTLFEAGDNVGADASNFMQPHGVPVSPRRFGDSLVFGTAPTLLSARRQDSDAVQRYPTVGERAASQTAALLAEHDQLLAEEEELLQRVQQLDDKAARLEREGAEQMHAFGERWAEVAASPLLSEEASRWLLTASGNDGGHTAASPGPLPRTSRRRLHAAEAAARSPTTTAPGAGSAHLERAAASPSGREAAAMGSPAARQHPQVDPDTPASGTYRAELDEETQRLQDLTRNMLLRQQGLLREQYHEREQPREREGSQVGGDIDADLLAMAAAAVARAKAAAAELAARERPSARHIDVAALAPPPLPARPQRAAAVGAVVASTRPAAAPATVASAAASAGQAAPPQQQAQAQGQGVYITDMASMRSDGSGAATQPGSASTAPVATAVPPTISETVAANTLYKTGSAKAVPLTARVTYPTDVHDAEHAASVGTSESSWQKAAGPSSPPSSMAGSLLAPPSTSQAASSSSRSKRGERLWDVLEPLSTPGPAPQLAAFIAGQAPSTSRASEAAYGAGSDAQALGHHAVQHALEGLRPETPLLVRLPLPDDLNSIAAEGLRQLWSGAALHYTRAQSMHEGAISQLEQQWERCQAQLQVLQAEEMQVRAAGRHAEAEAVASAAAKWRQRAAHLHAAMKRHGAEAARHKSLARRATSMGERLHVLSAAASSGAASTAAGLEAAAAVTELRQAGLVPQLPASVLAASPTVLGLERLQAALTEQIAALHVAAAGLQLQSQRTFAKATGRSKKLQVRLGSQPTSTAHASALHKSHAYAEQAALLGERAVEQATQSRELAALADRLSGESANLGQVTERLQRAMEQELRAQQALVQAADLVLCEAMQAALFGAGLTGALAADGSMAAAPCGDLDSLLTTGYAVGVCAAAANAEARCGEDLAQEALRAVQGTKEALESRLASFARVMEDVSGALAALAARRSAQRESLLTQVQAATTYVARANAKAASRRNAGDTEAAGKYAHAAEGWAKQADKLSHEARVYGAAAEELVQRARALSGLSGRVRPLQVALDKYLDEQLDAWAAAALERVHLRADL